MSMSTPIEVVSSNGRGAAPPREEAPPQTSMRVRKRSGAFEPVDVNKIVRAVGRSCVGLADVDSLRIATKTISGLYDGATTRELDQLSIQTAAGLIVEEPQYAKLAARLLATYVDKEVRGQEIHAFSQSVAVARRLGLVNERLGAFVADNARKLNDAVAVERDREFEYFGLRTVYDRYLLKHPQSRLVVETAQQFFLRIACALSESVGEALELYSCSRRWSTCRARRRCSTRGRGTSSSRAASCSIRPPIIWRRSTGATPTWRCSRSSRAASAWRTIASGRAGPSSRGPTASRTASSLAQDTGRLGGGGQSGGQAQGGRLRLSRAVARRHRGVPGAARQHRRRGEPNAQPEPGQLDP